MVNCSSCGRPIEKMPDWLRVANVDFVCNNCPNRHAKNIAFVDLNPEPVTPQKAEPARAEAEEPEEEEES
jgi:hypothetical protein